MSTDTPIISAEDYERGQVHNAVQNDGTIVDRATTEEEKSAYKRDKNAKKIIALHVAPDLREEVYHNNYQDHAGAVTAYTMCKCLEKNYSPEKTESAYLALTAKMQQLSPCDYTTFNKYFLKLSQTNNRLGDIDPSYKKNDKALIMFMFMTNPAYVPPKEDGSPPDKEPHLYDSFTTVNNSKIETMTLAEFKKAYAAEWERLGPPQRVKNSGVASNSKVLAIFRGTCHNCKETGHMAHDCPHPKESK